MERRADARFTAAPLQLCGNDARVVEHEHVPAAQQLRQVAHPAIAERCRVAFDQQHARGIARTYRTQRDTFVGKFEIEEVNFHRPRL